MALMRTVAAIWQQETVAESARAIHALGTELHKRLGTFSGHLAKAGRALDSAVGSYNEAVGSFESRVLVQARKLEQHGIGDELASPLQVERQARSVAAEAEPEPHASDRAVVELPRDAHAA
jgi:DNA recombination protein RmuC